MKIKKVYHMGIPVDDIDRAQDFYTNVLGLQFMGRTGGNHNNPDAVVIHGKVARLARLMCGSDEVVLFERPRALQKDHLNQDGIAHQAFEMDIKDYEDALKTAREIGKFHRIVERGSGKTIYMFDSEGNYLELHFSTGKEGRAEA